MNQYNSYEEIIEVVKQKCLNSEDEMNRISKEDELFRSRKWTNYVLTLVNFCNDHIFYDCSNGIVLGGSAIDSYIIQSAVVSEISMRGEPLRQRSTSILFNDALRVICETHSGFVSKNEIAFLENKLTEYLDLYHLKYKKIVMPNVFHGNYGTPSRTTDVFIVSNDSVSEEHVNVVRSEKQVSETEKDNQILRGLYLVYFPTISGL